MILEYNNSLKILVLYLYHVIDTSPWLIIASSSTFIAIVGLVTGVRVSLQSLSSVFNIEGTSSKYSVYSKFSRFLVLLALFGESGVNLRNILMKLYLKIFLVVVLLVVCNNHFLIVFLLAQISAIVIYTVAWKSGKLARKPNIESSSRYFAIGVFGSAVFLNPQIGIFIGTLSYLFLFLFLEVIVVLYGFLLRVFHLAIYILLLVVIALYYMRHCLSTKLIMLGCSSKRLF